MDVIHGKLLEGGKILINLDLPARTSVVIKPMHIDWSLGEVVVVIESYNCLNCFFHTTSKEELMKHKESEKCL